MFNIPRESSPVPLVATIIGLAIVLRALHFSGYVSGDDAAYVAHALEYLKNPEYMPYSHWGTRLLLILPTAASISIFGVNAVSIAIFPFLCSIATIIVAYRLAKSLFDVEVAILSAALVAIFPMEVIFASHLFPYAIVSFLSALCLMFLVEANRHNDKNLFFAAGLTLGMAYLARITALYNVLFLLAFIIYTRKFKKSVLWFAVGLGAVVAAEAVFYSVNVGDPFYRINVLTGKVGAAAAVAPTTEHLINLKWILEPFIRPMFEQEIGFYFVVFWPIAFYRLFLNRNKATTLLLLWILPIFLYTAYGTTSPSGYNTLRRLPRYLSPIIVPCLIIIAYQIRTLKRPVFRYALISMLIGSSILSLIVDTSTTTTSREKRIAAYIRERPTEQFVVPRSLYYDVSFYLGLVDYAGSVRMILMANKNDRSDTLKRIYIVEPDVTVLRAEALEPGALVFLDSDYTDRNLIRHKQVLVEEFSPNPTIKDRLLTIPIVIELLSKLRDPARMKGLRSSRGRENVQLIKLE